MINLGKLAALDVGFLGYRFVVAEYIVGVYFSAALGLFVLYRRHCRWQVVLGIYLISLGINYIPMLAYTLSSANKESALAELGSELADKIGAISKYRRQSLFLRIPLAAPILAIVRRQGSESP